MVLRRAAKRFRYRSEKSPLSSRGLEESVSGHCLILLVRWRGNYPEVAGHQKKVGDEAGVHGLTRTDTDEHGGQWTAWTNMDGGGQGA